MAKPFLSATPIKVQIDQKELLKAISFENQVATALAIRKEIIPQIENAQEQMIKDFMSHSVSKEIASGPTSTNLSSTLSGYGNLFSFIGFERNQNPLAVINDILSKKIVVKVRTISSGKFKITLYIPTKEEIYQSTPLPWASGSSWTEGIEAGISNLGSYLYSSTGFKESTSGTGLQIKNLKKSVTFKTTPYISEIMKKFRNRLQKIGS